MGGDTTRFRTEEAPSGAPAPHVRVGDVIAQKYRVDQIIGSGGMGLVLAVTHLTINEPFAIKMLHAHSQRDPETILRFKREAQAAVRIHSEHVMRVHDVGQLDNGAPYMVMEYLVGCDLADELAARGPLPVAEAVEYVLQACAGVAEAHALGIVHRDLKPSNLFLTRRSDGAAVVKILDFGIAKAMEATPHTPSITQTQSAFGSPGYMSPEQVRSTKKVDFRTDIWALGVILFELLTGKLPFEADNAAGLLAAIAADNPHDIRQLRPDVNEALASIVERCLQKDVAKRFQSVSELATALAPFASGGVVSVGRIQRLSRPASHAQPAPTPRSSAHAIAAVTDTELDVQVSTQLPERDGIGRLVGILVGALLGAALLIGGGVFLARRSVALPAPAPPTAPSASEAPTALAVASTVAIVPPEPKVEATASASAPTKIATRPGMQPRIVASSKPSATSIVVPPPATSPTTITKPPPDPTAESH